MENLLRALAIVLVLFAIVWYIAEHREGDI